MSDFRHKTLNALAWGLGSRVVTQAASFVIGVTIARLLSPEDYGLIAIAMLFIGLAGLISNVGLGASLVQYKSAGQKEFSSVFWLNLGLSIALATTIYLSSFLASSYFERTELENVLKILSFSFVIAALTMVPQALLSKAMDFKGIALANTAALIFGGGLAIAMALRGFEYWSLIAQQLCSSFVILVVVWKRSRWFPSLFFSWTVISNLMRFSISVFATSLLQYTAKSLDRFLLGKYLGSYHVGVYDKAHSMMLFPLQNISHVVGEVMFPSFSSIQDEKDRIGSVYLRAVGAIALVTFPMMGGIYAVAESFTLGVLGEHWKDIIPVLRILSLAGLFTSIVTLTGSIYLSTGHAGLQLRVNLITKPITISLLIAGLSWGVEGVAYAFFIASAMNTLITLSVAGRLINVKLRNIWEVTSNTLACSVVMSVITYLSASLLEDFGYVSQFVMQLMVGVVIYTLLLFGFKNQAFLDVREVIVQKFQAKTE